MNWIRLIVQSLNTQITNSNFVFDFISWHLKWFFIHKHADGNSLSAWIGKKSLQQTHHINIVICNWMNLFCCCYWFFRSFCPMFCSIFSYIPIVVIVTWTKLYRYSIYIHLVDLPLRTFDTKKTVFLYLFCNFIFFFLLNFAEWFCWMRTGKLSSSWWLLYVGKEKWLLWEMQR